MFFFSRLVLGGIFFLGILRDFLVNFLRKKYHGIVHHHQSTATIWGEDMFLELFSMHQTKKGPQILFFFFFCGGFKDVSGCFQQVCWAR